MKELETETELEEILKQDAVILQFGSASCAPCIAIKQRIDAWTAEHSQVISCYIPVEKWLSLSAKMNVFSAPTVIALIQGKVVEQQSGYFSLDRILDRMERILSLMEE